MLQQQQQQQRTEHRPLPHHHILLRLCKNQWHYRTRWCQIVRDLQQLKSQSFNHECRPFTHNILHLYWNNFHHKKRFGLRIHRCPINYRWRHSPADMLLHFFPPHISACYLLQQLHCLEWQRARERARTHASVNWLLFKLIVEPSEAMTQTQEWDSLTCCLRICGLTLLPGVETKIPMFPVKRLKSTFKRTQNSSSDDTKSEVLSALPPVTEASILHWFLYIKLLSSSHWSLFLLHSFNWTVSAGGSSSDSQHTHTSL